MGKGKSGAKSLPPLLSVGEILRDRYVVGAMIGGGGFGQIFRGLDKTRDDDVAIKIEPSNVDKRRMRLEHSVLVLLRGKPHIPKIRGSGQIRGCSFIVMNLLGRNLSELRRREKDRKLTISTTFRIAVKITSGLRQMHEVGYLHRDVKPSNCCIGRSDAERHEVYILDFGMTRKFKNSDGTVRKARDYVGFRGTVRYASLTVHARREPGPGDDLVGLLYSLIELAKGTLPWTHLREAREVEEKKLDTSLEDLCESLPLGVLKFAYHVLGLRYDQMPDYELINTHFQSCWPVGVTDETPYDWEIGHDKSGKESSTNTSTPKVSEEQREMGKTADSQQILPEQAPDDQQAAGTPSSVPKPISPLSRQDQQQQLSQPAQSPKPDGKPDSEPDNRGPLDPDEPHLMTASE